MMKAYDIKNFFENHKGETLDYGDYSIQVYQDGEQGAIFREEQAILKIETKAGDKNAFYFYLPRKEDSSCIFYADGVRIRHDETIKALYEHFSEHERIDDVLIALLMLKQKLIPDELNQNVLYCRDALRRSRAYGKIESGDTLIVSSFRPDGRYSTEYIKADIDQIAAAICANDYDKLFCNSNDYALFNTIGRKLDTHVGLEEHFIEELMLAINRTEHGR